MYIKIKQQGKGGHRVARFAMVLFALSVCLCGCHKGEPDKCTTRPTNNKHTLIIYMGGDNNLSWETDQKLEQIQKFASKRSANTFDGRFDILIYQAGSSARQPNAYLWRVAYGKQKPELLKTYPIAGSASKEVFAAVMADCRALSPASNYGLWVFSHASGWLPSGTLTSPRSVIEEQGTEMDIHDFAQAIPDGAFQYMVFEACFMAGIEVAYELKDKTEYIIASSAEMLSPGFSDIYQEVLPDLFEGNFMAFAQKYFNHWNGQISPLRSATISLLATQNLDRLAQVVGAMMANASRVVDVSKVQHFDRYWLYKLFFDLEHYMQLRCGDLQMPEFKKAISDVVLYCQATPEFLISENGFKINRHCGLTAYIKQEKFPFLNQKYNLLGWSNAINSHSDL